MSRKQHFIIRPFILIYLIYICRALLTSTSSSNNYLRLSIIEEVPAGSYVGSVIVNGDSSRRPSPETSSRLTYQILTTPALPFSVENRTGKIYTEGSIDRDSLMLCKDKATCEVKLDVTVKNEKYFEIVKVIVEILDINDNEPYFKDKSATIFIRESVSVGTTFQLPVAYDLDGPKYAVKLYKLSECSTNNVGLKVLRREDSSLDPRLVVMSALDRETEEEYSAKLTAYDGGEPAKSASIDLKIVIADANDNKPVFEKTIYEINVNEDVKVGSIIAKIKAHDKDVGENGIVTYQLLDQVYNTYGSTFAIDRSSGYLKVNSKLDRETISIYHLTVLAEDQGPGSVAVDAKVVIRVLDVNDNKPKIIISTLTSRDTEVTEVWENQTGSFVAHVTVTDPDNGVNGTVRCSFVLKNKNPHEKNDNNFQKTNNSDKEKTSHMLRVHSMFQLVKRYNTEYQIILNGSLDREECSSYTLKLTCEDEGAPAQRSHKSLEIIVKDVNDNPPVFEKEFYVVDVLENNFINQKFLKLVVSDADQEPSNFIQFFSSLVNVTHSSPSSSSSSSSSTQVSLSSLPTYVKTDEHGNMYLTEVLDRESIEMLSIQVLAVDSGTIRLTATASVHVIVGDVNDEKPQFINADNENRHSVNDKFFENINMNKKHHFFDNYNLTLSYPLYVFHVEENNEPNTAIGQILAVDRDVSASNNEVTYWFNTGPPSLASSITTSSSSSSTMSTKLSYDGLNEERVYLNNRSGLFELDSVSGVLRVAVGLDHESQSVFKLSVVAVDSGRPTQMAHCDVTIHVADLNDNDPVFEKFFVHQSQLVVKYKQKNVIEQQNEKQLEVDQLLLRHPMNETHYEMFPFQNVLAEHSSVGAFDNNTNRPVIYISPMTPVNKIIFKTLASDADRGENAKITYSMQYKNFSDEGYFEINKNNGIVSVQKLLSNILHKEVTIILRATDRGLPARWTEAVIDVVINHTVPYSQHFYDYSERAEDDYQVRTV
ncbi:hypothetical protein HELRODRAFT_161213 [Helobdella robusta]|uniref:Cadherin domain-containing protein n=1 Tax=Helobdella robusta TaxID=6412 RepID=T1ER79_HELRO|nr:hypothetical protein HELRODRAFT_161213 [Helobdella robusta]ESO01995.1 hypothetical protein HELRODRAFT_161213 [Helobdella robusta]